MSWDEIKKDSETVSGTPNQPPVSTAQPKKEKKEDIIYSDERIKAWLFGDMEKSSSNICCALYGFDGTAKSGIALDCRTEQEKKDEWKVIVFDLDGGCAPLKVIYHDNDKNIIIKNPLVRNELKSVDYEETFLKLKASLDYIERNLSTMKIKAIVFDGLDKFLKICEYSMRDDLNKSVMEGVDYRYWKIRSQKYHDILERVKLMDVDRYFITHLKKDFDTDEWNPDWEKKTPDMMFQKVKCYREQKVVEGNKIVYLKAVIEKCKTNLALEGKVFTVSETMQTPDGKATAKWYGLKFTTDNKITQNKQVN
jgi:hypothetical protein